MDEVFITVEECSSKDAGRGLGRIDPVYYDILKVEIGNLIKITGKKQTAVRVMPSFFEDRGKSIIQIDGITRENAGTSINERVRIEKLEAPPARNISIEPQRLIDKSNTGIVKNMPGVLDGQPVIEGDRIRLNIFGFYDGDIIIGKTEPSGFSVINKNTVFTIKTQNVKLAHKKITYEDIGGLKEQTRKIREMIELPLKYPDLFERLGIEAPKGVLMYGPPGTGKTLIARAVANETSTHFICINGPEIIQKFYGESEANLRKIFDEAGKNAPSIIFIDEIDAIAPKRGNVVGDVEKRVVTQLLALLDGVENRGQIVVIGATNMPELLDTALRRPGRLDREIYIGVPDRKGRLEILNIHTRAIPLDDDVDLERISEITYGFVGADIAHLCKEAAMIALRRILPDIDLSGQNIPYDEILKLRVNMNNFIMAFNQIEPSAMREVFVEMPKTTWGDVGGLKRVKEILENEVRLPLMYPKLFEKAGIRPGRGILLSGPPGTGKTLAAKALARETGLNFIYVKGPELMSKWVGESEKGIREVFKKARLVSPCILFFDEIDAIAPKRGLGGSDSGVSERVISQILVEMDGIEKREGVIILAATNRIEILDPAIIRPGRFDTIIRIAEPVLEEALEIFQIHTRKMPVRKDISFGPIIGTIKKPTGASIENICKKAAMLAIKKYIDKNKENMPDDSEELIIEEEDFCAAVEQLDY